MNGRTLGESQLVNPPTQTCPTTDSTHLTKYSTTVEHIVATLRNTNMVETVQYRKDCMLVNSIAAKRAATGSHLTQRAFCKPMTCELTASGAQVATACRMMRVDGKGRWFVATLFPVIIPIEATEKYTVARMISFVPVEEFGLAWLDIPQMKRTPDLVQERVPRVGAGASREHASEGILHCKCIDCVSCANHHTMFSGKPRTTQTAGCYGTVYVNSHSPAGRRRGSP